MAKEKATETPVLGPDFARLYGLPPSQVYRAIKSGFFAGCSYVDPKTGKVWLYPSAAKSCWDKNRDHTKAANLAKAATVTNGKLGPKRTRLAAKVPDAAKPPGDVPEVVNSTADLKNQALRIKIQFDALELQKRRGILVDKSRVYSALFEIGKEIRLALLTIPDRTVDAMLAAGNRAEAHSILLKEIHDNLDRISETISRDFIKNE